MSPTRNPIRASLISAEGVEEVFMAYSIPLPRVTLWTRKEAVSGWVPRYGSGPRKGVGCARCGSLGCSEAFYHHMESYVVSKVASTGRVDG